MDESQAWPPGQDFPQSPKELSVSLGPEFDVKERVRQATNIVDLIGSYLPLRRMGANYVALCPWHSDSRPSLQVNPARQSWKCWPCDIGGDVFSFIMRRENVDFRQALEILADRAGIEIRGVARPVAPEDPSSKQNLYKALQWATKRFQDSFHDPKNAATAREYILKRGIEEKSIESFQIGFSPNRWDWLVDQAKDSNFELKTLELAGLIGKRQRGQGYYDRFKGRVIFPIADLQGRTIGFGGRILPEFAKADEQESGRTPAKYVNSPETRLFSKSQNLFGLNLIREHIQKSRKLVIVEGYTDVLMAHQFGFENVTACLGTAINSSHISLLQRFADEVVLLLDGDDAGQRRTNELLDLFVASELNLKIAVLPETLDPCDLLLNRGAEEFQQFIDDSVDALEHKFNVETQDIDLIKDTHAANQSLERILTTLSKNSAKLGTRKLREQQMLAKLARNFRLQEDILRNRLTEIRRRNSNYSSRLNFESPQGEDQTEEKTISLAECDPKEVELLELLLANPGMFQETIENISPDQFVMGELREIYEAFVEVDRYDREPGFDSVMLIIENDEIKSLLVELDERATKKQQSTLLPPEQELKIIVSAFQKQLNEMSRKQLTARLEGLDPTSDEDDKRLIEQMTKLHMERIKKN